MTPIAGLGAAGIDELRALRAFIRRPVRTIAPKRRQAAVRFAVVLGVDVILALVVILLVGPLSWWLDLSSNVLAGASLAQTDSGMPQRCIS